MRRPIILCLSAILLLAAGCTKNTRVLTPDYEQTINAWHEHRNAGLRSPDGWLTLAGLFWLEPGHEETIGSASSNDFVLPPNSAPADIGRLRLDGKKVTFTNLAGSAVTVDGKPVSAPIVLSSDEDHPTTVHVGSVSFYAIERSGRFGIRAKDSNSPVLRSFKGMTFFPVNPNLRFADARFIPDSKKIPILSITGKTDLEESPGIVEFKHDGGVYRLRPIYEGKTLFFLFKDPTNKTDTYPAGRMLNTPLPENGKVDLDFNRSYNPPCTFTPYATCPLPPRENALNFPVQAGEKRYRHGGPASITADFRVVDR